MCIIKINIFCSYMYMEMFIIDTLSSISLISFHSLSSSLMMSLSILQFKMLLMTLFGVDICIDFTFDMFVNVSSATSSRSVVSLKLTISDIISLSLSLSSCVSWVNALICHYISISSEFSNFGFGLCIFIGCQFVLFRDRICNLFYKLRLDFITWLALCGPST